MPIKTQKPHAKSYPKHFAKVYWPYLPLAIVVAAGLWLGRPAGDHSQNSLQRQTTQISQASLLAETNQVRASHGVAPLRANSQLAQTAAAKANSMVKNNVWSNTAVPINESLAYGFDDSSQAINGWLSSTDHRASLLSSDYSRVGYGVATSQNYLQKGPETVIVAVYGSAQPATAAAPGAGSLPVLEAATASINKAQLLTGGQLPWIGVALAILGVGTLVYLALKHSVAWRKHVKKGERYVLKHPVFDLTLVAVAALCALLCQTVGFIR